jgi:hypothetical protein
MVQLDDSVPTSNLQHLILANDRRADAKHRRSTSRGGRAEAAAFDELPRGTPLFAQQHRPEWGTVTRLSWLATTPARRIQEKPVNIARFHQRFIDRLYPGVKIKVWDNRYT